MTCQLFTPDAPVLPRHAFLQGGIKKSATQRNTVVNMPQGISKKVCHKANVP
jgi:hypothetical protein